MRITKTAQLLGVLIYFVHIQLAIATETPQVVVSIKPIHSILSGLMQEVEPPLLLIGDGQTPYGYSLDSTSIAQLSKARLIVWVGSELEYSLQSAIGKLAIETKVIELLSHPDLKILPARGNPTKRDPYFWLDDRNIIILLNIFTDALIDIDPARAHIYIRNRLRMLKPLRLLDKQQEFGYRGLKAGLAVQYFDTLQYFEQAYALNTLGRVADSPLDNLERSKNILNLRRYIKNNEANCLLLDKSLPAEHVELITDGLEVNIGLLDALGLEFHAGSDLYIQLMEHNTREIKRCVNAEFYEDVSLDLAAEQRDNAVLDGLGGRFVLTNHLGLTVTEQDLLGQHLLIFFGYTNCPDVCPMSLTTMSRAFKILGSDSNKIKPVFISVDPTRDSAKILHDYVNFFDKNLMGLTGSQAMIDRVTKLYKVKFRKVLAESGTNPELYTIDHTASFFLMAPDGSFIKKFANAVTSEALAEELKEILNREQ